MKKIVLFVVALMSVVSLQAQGDLHLFEVNNKSGKITPLIIEEAFTKNGFSLGINSEMNGPFTKQFQQTDFKVFTLLTVYHTEFSKDLVNKYPQAGVFIPMGVGIYQGANEDTLHISMLTAETQAKILGSDTVILKKIEKAALKVVNNLLPNAKHNISKDSLKESRNLVTQYEMDLDGEDWADMREEFEMNLEAGFEPFGFVMPSFMDYNEELTQEGSVDSPYDFYDTYSICKLKVIYNVAKTRPEASAFAPCTTMVYKKKDEDKIVVGFPAVYNWLSSARIEDKNAHDVLMKAQKDFESILKDITE
ncbi:DUF302 domain-containing protein [Sulfurimonas aquatica]|uniref:DUF302 domain-containing protein n=1 Tax=Sulfurimonas aquatica TaxID=2672570 RepID=A0A975GCY0_9BACT|nr:DUF302 domain-containing protein [Sulfurimonas aquatica]QSZ41992.1 DUF302 domain-containing protein [Sulfurimonas aquatica]